MTKIARSLLKNKIKSKFKKFLNIFKKKLINYEMEEDNLIDYVSEEEQNENEAVDKKNYQGIN